MSEPAAKPAKSQSGFGTWIDHHAYSVVSGLGRLLRRPWATALTIGVMAVALALPLGLLLVLGNVARLSGSVQQSQEISVFLAMDTSAERLQALERDIAARADVATVELRTPEQGLEELRTRGGLGDAIDGLGGLDANPLPAVLVVVPAMDNATLAAALGALPEAELVVHDAAWRQRLDAWMRFAARVAWVLAALLGIGALLVVGNTVRLDIQSRREEIAVLQLLGATDGFIRRPFLYQGAWYGLAAGALALGLLALAGLALQAPLAELVAGYGSGFALHGFGLPQSLAVVAGAALLGWLGAGVVTGHYLRQTRPTEA
ncbi:ABC transporter permease [Luteimonas yindakuii]|uniref:permease-like cell division protein FtsX n=1 Tax=Luteimonas yindakuii TaxID=2565782 RepID=UPI0011079562|nr:permease-like cell division protein FtsX [Luteimonas yindakuii]QCO68557.2 ABC transporter permease [Luteimonas yindakuii]